MTKKITFFIAALFSTFLLHAQPTNEIQKILGTSGSVGNVFGWSINVSGDYAIVGASSYENGGLSKAGAAYVFYNNSGNWEQQALLTASDASANDYFGWSVSISENYAIVGAYQAHDGGLADCGKAYIFSRNGSSWSEQAIITPSVQVANANFGNAVSISGDYAIVGCFRDKARAATPLWMTGAAYIFKRDGTSWDEQQQLISDDLYYLDYFGSSVCISGDDVIVGAYNAGVTYTTPKYGAAYVFTRSGTTWTQQSKLEASVQAHGDRFGQSVGISGDYAIVGANYVDSKKGAAYAFNRSGTTWTQQTKMVASDAAVDDEFGFSVGISGDRAFVGAPYDDDGGVKSGSAYQFVRSGTSWSQNAKWLASDDAAGDYYGNSVSISNDYAFVGAPYDVDRGSAYIFGLNYWTGATNNTWNTSTNWFGQIVPGADEFVTIPTGRTNYPTLSAAGSCNNIRIKSDATGTGSLLGNSNLTVGSTAIVERYIPQYSKGTTGFHFLSSPVATQNISTEFFDVGTPPAGVDFYYFNEVNNYWINIKNVSGDYNQGDGWQYFSNDDNPSFTVGKGYFVAYNTNVTKNFTGTLNSGDKASGTGIPALTYTTGKGEGWNLIGNPYPSAIDWDLGTWSLTNVDASVYVYDGTAGQYKSWNGSSGTLTDGIIPAMQGFFVKGNASSPSLTIPDASRVHSSQNYYKSSETITDLLVLKVAGNAYKDEIFINFNENASTGFDNDFDAYKLYGTEEAPQLYSIITDEKLSINVLPYSDEEVFIPLGLEVGAANEYVISVKENTFFETVQIYLEDLKNGTKTELKTTTKYTFTSNPDDEPERFMLQLATHYSPVKGRACFVEWNSIYECIWSF